MKRAMHARARCLSLALLLTAVPWSLHPTAAAADSQAYARVVVDHVTVRSGPGGAFRTVYIAERGETYPIRARATRAYWLQIELPDSTLGWIPGDVVYTHEVADGEYERGGFLPGLFAPPPLLTAHGEVAITGGTLGGGGLIALRPSVLVAPTLGVEVSALAAVASGGRLLQATVGPIINPFPRAPITPFATVQGGITTSSPNADTFLLETGSVATLSAGAGLRLGFHYRITLRLEARAHLFFEPDRHVSQEEFSAGLTVFY